jgi:transposase-like protein
MAFTPEEKQEIIDEYLKEDATPETTIEIVKMIADGREVSVNAIRFVLTDAEVYVKKTPAASATKSKTGTGTPRVSKEDAIAELKAAITEAGKELDEGILDKLTGKAATYLLTVIR